MSSEFKLSPSSSERFLTCTASLPFNVTFTENEATLKGNLQHEVASLRLGQILFNEDNSEKINLLTNYDHDYVSQKNPNLKVRWTKDCETTVDNYVSYVKQMRDQYNPAIVLIECKIKMRFFDNNVTGIIDCAMILKDGDIIIIDLKTGRVKVDTDENKQMLMYAFGIIQDSYVKTGKLPKNVIISICQSLVNNTQAIKYSLEQLVTWYGRQAQPMHEINSHSLVFRPSKTACKYCQHRDACNERIKAGVV